MTVVETARTAILTQLEPLEQAWNEAKHHLDEIEQTKAQLEAALRALKPDKKSRSKANRKAGKPFARKADVHAVCIDLVKQNSSISKDDLESLAKHKLGEEQGFNLSGVSLRLSECLSSDTFLIAPDGTVTLASGA